MASNDETTPPRRGGRHTFYPGKVLGPVTTTLTQEAHDILTRLERHSGASRSDLVTHAVLLLGEEAISPELDTALRAPVKQKKRA